MFRRVVSVLISLLMIFQNVSYSFSLGQREVTFLRSREAGGFLNGLILRGGSIEFVLPRGLSSKRQKQLVNEFLFCLAVPERLMWVNLSGEVNLSKILPLELRVTDIGKVFLEADLRLKQDFLRLYSDVVWGYELDPREVLSFPERLVVVPEKVILEGSDEGIVIKEARLGIKCIFPDGADKVTVRKIERNVISRLKERINRADEYKDLRRIYRAVILAYWYKERLRKSSEPLPFKDLVDSSYVIPFLSPKAWSKWDIYRNYLHSYLAGNEIETVGVKFVVGGVNLNLNQLYGGFGFLHLPIMKLLDLIKRQKGRLELLRLILKPAKRFREANQIETYEEITFPDGKKRKRSPGRVRADLGLNQLSSELLSRTWRFFVEDRDRQINNSHYLRGLIESQYLRPTAVAVFNELKNRAVSKNEFIYLYKRALLNYGLKAFRIYLNKYNKYWQINIVGRIRVEILFYQQLRKYLKGVNVKGIGSDNLSLFISPKGLNKKIKIEVSDGLVSFSIYLVLFPIRTGRVLILTPQQILALIISRKLAIWEILSVYL